MNRLSYLVLTTMFVLVTGIVAYADQVVLKNGDRITGKIIKQDSESIVIETEFAGTITIPKNKVEKWLTDADLAKEQAVAKETAKDSATETIVETAADKKSEEITYEKAVYVKPAETVDNGDPENAEAMTGKIKNGKMGFTSGWDGTANVGFSLTSGNSDNTLLTTGVRAEKSGENDKWTTYGNMLWNRSKVAGVNLTTSNAIWGGLRYDRNITKKVFAFGSFDFERDKPQLLNMRNVFGGGLGYHAIKNDKTELDLFSGLAYNRTWFVGPNTNAAELLVGNTFKHKFNDKVKFQQGFTLYPNLSDGGEYRFIFDSTLSADLTKRIGWFVSVGDRFNSIPLPGIEKNDFLFATGLKVGFGKTK